MSLVVSDDVENVSMFLKENDEILSYIAFLNLYENFWLTTDDVFIVIKPPASPITAIISISKPIFAILYFSCVGSPVALFTISYTLFAIDGSASSHIASIIIPAALATQSQPKPLRYLDSFFIIRTPPL